MRYDFQNDKQRTAAKIILKRCARDVSPNKLQLAKLVVSKSDYKTQGSAKSFVKDFINDSSTPVESTAEGVIRSDIKKGVVE